MSIQRVSAFARPFFSIEDSHIGFTPLPALAVVPRGTPALWSKLARLSGFRPARADEAVPLRDSAQAAHERLALIASAKTSILATVYCLAPDDGGVAYVNALTAAAKRGVQVVFARDGVARLANASLGNRTVELERALSALEAAGGTVLTFGSLFENLGSLGRGLHLKTLAVDGKYAITGGRNIGDIFDVWPDYDVRFTGEIAANITLQTLPVIDRVLRRSGQALGLSSEHRVRLYATLADMERAAREERQREQAEAGPRYSVIVADPVALRRSLEPKDNPATQALIALMDAAERSIVFSSNYVRVIPAIADAIVRARERHVEITVVTTGLSGSKLSTMSYYDAEDDYAWLRANGVKVVETRAQEHGKMFIFDDELLLFGSYNVEHHADQLLVEGVIVTDDARLLGVAKRALKETIATRAETVTDRKAVEPNPILAFFSRILAFILSPFL